MQNPKWKGVPVRPTRGAPSGARIPGRVQVDAQAGSDRLCAMVDRPARAGDGEWRAFRRSRVAGGGA